LISINWFSWEYVLEIAAVKRAFVVIHWMHSNHSIKLPVMTDEVSEKDTEYIQTS
jgi:hypothetical protein